MSNMCTCHIDPENCEWCKVQSIKGFFQRQHSGNTTRYITDMLWMAEKLEEYMIKEASVAPQKQSSIWDMLDKNSELTALQFMNSFKGYENTCGSCKFFDTTDNRCRERSIFVKTDSPKCPQWRYFA